jgi:hypothetical protein
MDGGGGAMLFWNPSYVSATESSSTNAFPVDGSGDGSCTKSSFEKIGGFEEMIFTPGLSRMEGFIVPNEAKLLGLLGVCPVSESRIKRIELREGDTALRGIWLEVVEPAEVLGRSSEGANGVSDSDPDSWLLDRPSVSSMKVTGDVIRRVQISSIRHKLNTEFG